MNTYGGALVTVILAGTYAEATMQDDTIITEDGFDLLTEDGHELLTETAN